MRITVIRTAIAMLVAGLLMVGTNRAEAVVTAFTSFENEPAVGDGVFIAYFDTGDGNTSHDLVNNPEQPLVDSTLAGSGAAGDLGFNARIVNTRTVLGLTDGDDVGVSNNLTDVSAYPDGTQGYKFQDTDDLMVLEFDPVSIVAPTLFEIDYFITSTNYEVTAGAFDMVRIFLTIDGSLEVPLLDTAGFDIDDFDVEGRWITAMVDLTGLGSTAVLTVAVDTDAPNEEVYIDRVTFTQVPEPSSIVMACLAGLSMGLVALRRRKK